jgi:hypothetical protein
MPEQRNAQEGLNHVAKRADADRVSISLRSTSCPTNVDRKVPRRVELEVREEG